MGTQSVFPIDTIFKRREPKGDGGDELRVVGAGHELIVTSNVEFGPNVSVTREQLVSEYDFELPPGAVLHAPTVNPQGLSPEEQFARDQGLPVPPAVPEVHDFNGAEEEARIVAELEAARQEKLKAEEDAKKLSDAEAEALERRAERVRQEEQARLEAELATAEPEVTVVDSPASEPAPKPKRTTRAKRTTKK